MEDKQTMITEKLVVSRVQHGMKNNEIIHMEKLDVLVILKESIKIPYKCPQFIFLTFLTSLPLIFGMILHEIILQASMSETKSILTPPPPVPDYYDDLFYSYSYHGYYLSSFDSALDTIFMLFRKVSPRVLQLAFLYLVPLHLMDLYNTIITITSASIIYAGKTVRIGEMLLAPFRNGGFMGSLVTSLYVLFLNCFVLSGLIWAVMNSVIPATGFFRVFYSPISTGFFRVIYSPISVVLIVKWIEWSAVWNMGIVFSVLDGRHKLAALMASGYFSRGNRKRGFQLMLLFFVWRIILRLSCYFMGGQEKWVGLLAASFFSCVGNISKWVVCTVYFYDCKKRTMEKKVDAEGETKDANDNTGPTVYNDV